MQILQIWPMGHSPILPLFGKLITMFPVSPKNSLPLSAYAQDITWTDSATNVINRTNDTHVYTVRGGSVDLITVDEVEHDYDWGTNAAISQPSTLSPYELSVPSTMTDLQHPHSNRTQRDPSCYLRRSRCFCEVASNQRLFAEHHLQNQLQRHS